eukprot:c20424_g2_i1.p1 GENE.c20424_g2_i1~~c20424_g2_i1.p1  ORF type:complete len:409 (+),score=176.72 c20424_g2_i1:37-1227(+)
MSIRFWSLFVALNTILVHAILPGGDNVEIQSSHLPVPFDKCSIESVSDGNMKVVTIAWGYDNSFWINKRTDVWEDWQSIGGSFVGGPTAIRTLNNDIVIFGCTQDRTVFTKTIYENGQQSEWSSLGGDIIGARISALVDSFGLIHVFAQGHDSRVWELAQYISNTGEILWADWAKRGALTVTSSVTSILDAEGFIHLFARGVDNSLWTSNQKFENGKLEWNDWQNQFESIHLSSSSSIIAKLNSQNLLEVHVRAGNKNFWRTHQVIDHQKGLIWSSWSIFSGLFSSSPVVDLNFDGVLTIFGRGPEKGVWYKQQKQYSHEIQISGPLSENWSDWVPLGGRFSAGIDVIQDNRGYSNIFGAGLDKSIWTRNQVMINGTIGFYGPWKSLGGHFRTFPC